MSFHKECFYHIYNRGCNKELIFYNDRNYLFLLQKIKSTYKKYGANIIAYCLPCVIGCIIAYVDNYNQNELPFFGICENIVIITRGEMPNHYHLLVKQLTDQPLSDWIRNIFNGYTQAINKEQGRSGTLFEGRAKHILIDKEEYLIHLVRYIHYNPVATGLVDSPEEWLYSNYLEWIGKRNGSLFDKKFFSIYFNSFDEYQKFMEEYKIGKQLEKKLKGYYLG
ncbi:MAG: transposase [Candidatus Cloacimonetes bacterium]|nr:transposase [Candidatus Cloacimonadota bacterium]